MPYADPKRRRAAQREAQRRRRATGGERQPPRQPQPAPPGTVPCHSVTLADTLARLVAALAERPGGSAVEVEARCPVCNGERVLHARPWGGALVVRCGRGCTRAAILAALGLEGAA